MKNVKKSLALLLSIGLTTSFFLTSCTSGGNNSSGSESSSSQEEIEKTGDYLLKDGNSSYKIVLPDDADGDEVLAGERLQSLFKEATDTFLPIVKDTEISAINSDDEYILIGDNDFAVENGMVPKQTDVKSTGYTIKTKDKCIYIAGGKSVGTLFGVYNFLGRILNYDYFAEEIYSLDKGVGRILPNQNKVSPLISHIEEGYDALREIIWSKRRMGFSFSGCLFTKKRMLLYRFAIGCCRRC